MANAQAGLFLIFAIDGIILGVLFDFFRILRKSFSTGNILTAIEDVLFWILAGGVILYPIFMYNNGIIRGYMFLGIFCGVLLYILTFSNFFIKINVAIINFIKKFVSIILIPIKSIIKVFKKVVLRPISIIFTRINIILKQYIAKLLKLTKKSKN